MKELIRRMPWGQENASQLEPLLTREWLVTNGLGGYAAGTVGGVVTRRYHGLLIAALPAPLGRMMMLPHLSEMLRLPDGRNVRLSGEERSGVPLAVYGAPYLAEFRLDAGLPIWRYRVDGVVVEKWILLPHEQNTVYVNYRLLEGSGPLRLKLLPTVHFRSHDAPVSAPLPEQFHLSTTGCRYELSAGPHLPVLRMTLHGPRPAFTSEPQKLVQLLYRIEESRGYDSKGDLWSPGYFRIDLARGSIATLVASTESWETIEAIGPEEASEAETARRMRLLERSRAAHSGLAGELVLAADQFVIRPAGRVEDAARVHAAGDEVRTVVAGYHWFTDWGRDTMISLEGLTLVTGREVEAGYILRTFAHYLRDGLLPNLFPEGQREGLYHTADATLWYFHALSRYLAYTNDRLTLRLLLPKLHDIIEHHVRGTRFGIGLDPADGLLRQGAEGYQLTWMDAKVGDWVVTPRRGKAVEINALWYNALRLMEQWTCEEEGQETSRRLTEYARRAKESFNARFWYAEGGHLYDVIDGPEGNDAACRPNQIFSFSLEYPVLDRERWEPVLRTVQDRLLTPVGLRSLAPGHPEYRSQYDGDLRARDAAYHQGTVWAWLIGPFVDAWLRVHPDGRAQAGEFLKGFEAHMDEACLGTISEVFDAEASFAPRGCAAQAWSVAEVLRALVATAPGPVGKTTEGARQGN